MLEGKKVNINTNDSFDPVPMDRYTVMAEDVDLIQQFNGFTGKDEDVLNYKFVILTDKPMPEKEGEKEPQSTRGRYLWKRCRPALNSRSWLGKLAKAIIGRELTKEETATFDPESVIGKQMDVMVEHKDSKDGQKTFVNIISFQKTAVPLEPISKEERPQKATIQKKTAPAIAPKAKDEAEELIEELDAEGQEPADNAEVEKVEASADAELAAAEAEMEELEAASKAAAAKAKLAKLRAAKK